MTRSAVFLPASVRNRRHGPARCLTFPLDIYLMLADSPFNALVTVFACKASLPYHLYPVYIGRRLSTCMRCT